MSHHEDPAPSEPADAESAVEIAPDLATQPNESKVRAITLMEKAKAELLGTFLFVFVIVGVGYASTLAGGISGIDGPVAIGLSLSLVIYLIGPISGGHVNPAVSFAFAVMRTEFTWKTFCAYVAAQVTGAYMACLVAHAFWYRILDDFEDANGIERGEENSAASAAVLLPQVPDSIPVFEGFWVELIGTMIFLLVIVSVTNARNPLSTAGLAPLWIGLTITIHALVMGPLSGFSINPARDFGARLAAATFGWESVAFDGIRNEAYIYWFGPLVGGVVGVFLYDMLLAGAIDKLPRPDGEEDGDEGDKVGRRATVYAVFANTDSQQKSMRDRLMDLPGSMLRLPGHVFDMARGRSGSSRHNQ